MWLSRRDETRAFSAAVVGGVLTEEGGMIDQRTAPFAALLLRLTLGGLFISHLYWKFEVRGFAQWWTALQDAGYPSLVLVYVLCAEFAGALLLIPGIFTRWVSLFALPLMIGATHFWLVRKGFFFTAAGAELPIVWGLALIVQALLGDGAYAVKVPMLGNDRLRRSQPA
jgi:putative oxidoreductase